MSLIHRCPAFHTPIRQLSSGELREGRKKGEKEGKEEEGKEEEERRKKEKRMVFGTGRRPVGQGGRKDGKKHWDGRPTSWSSPARSANSGRSINQLVKFRPAGRGKNWENRGGMRKK
jgi:hypothetical protein